MAVVWFEGLETGDDDGVISVSGGAIETVVTSRSAYAWRANVSAATAFLQVGTSRNPWWGQAEVAGYLTFHMYITTMPGAGENYYLWRTIAVSITRGEVYIDGDDSKVYVKSEGGTAVGSTGTLEAGKWYTVTIYKATGAHTRCWVRDRSTSTEIIDVVANSGSNDRSPADVYIGPWSSSTGNVVFDNIVFDSANDPYDALGDNYTIEALLPDGVGTDDDWTGAFTDVDDLPHDGTTTERDETDAQNFTQTCQDVSSLSFGASTIVSVMSYAYAITNATGSSYNFRCRMREGGSAVNSGNYTIGDSGPTTYTRGFAFIRNTSPAGSTWTDTILNTIETGAGRSTSGLGRTCSVTAVSLHVLYVIPPVSHQIQWWK